MNPYTSPKGFTIVELLVIIAIIGLLSSVVLAMATSGRGKARRAAVKTQFSNLRSVIAITENNGQTDFCDDPETRVVMRNFAKWFQTDDPSEDYDWSVPNNNNGYFGCISYLSENFSWGVYVRDDTPFYTPFYWCLGPDGLVSGQKSGNTEIDPSDFGGGIGCRNVLTQQPPG